MNISRNGYSQYSYGFALFTVAATACAPQPTVRSAEAPPPREPAATPVLAAANPIQRSVPADADPEPLAGGLCVEPASREGGETNEDGVGYLDPKIVQNVVQGGYFSMRECYEAGLARDTELTGMIQVRFVIDRDGRVSSARLDDNTLPDCEAALCMLEVYRGLEFPEPDGGRVTVVYPLTFTPS